MNNVVVGEFDWFEASYLAQIDRDPVLKSIFDYFGADAFRRSSGVDLFEQFIQKVKFSGNRCVEIGTYNGITAIILSRYFEEVVSIDIFPHTAKHAILDFTKIKNVRYVDVKSNEEKAELIRNMEFDAAYMDGNHEKDTLTDFGLVKKCKRVLFHEYWDLQQPVYDLVNQLRNEKRKSVIIEGKFACWDRR